MVQSRLGIEPIVLVNGSQDDTLRVVSIHRSLGGVNIDRCALIRDMGADSVAPIGDFFIGQSDAIIEVIFPFGGFDLLGFKGKAAFVGLEISERGEFQRYEGRLDHHLIGERTLNTHIRGGATEFSCNLPLVFNPLIDGTIEPNRTPTAGQTVAGEPYLIADPESYRTEQSRLYQAGDTETGPILWTMAEAAHYLCCLCNHDQPFVENPTLAECEQSLDTDRTLLQNLAIPSGVTLPIALDRLLQPYGYDHYIGFLDRTLKISFVKKSEGTGAANLIVQPPGEPVDPDRSMIPAMQLSYDVSQLINVMIVEGGEIEVEGTWELERAWESDHDELTAEELDIDHGTEYAEHPRVWRDFVLNEANDYTGTRDEIEDFPDVGADLQSDELFPTEVVNAFLPKRRRFFPALTKGDDGNPLGKHNGIEVEWFDVTDDADSSEGTWKPVPWAFEVLDKECGIRFGNVLPVEMMDQFHRTGAKIRVTACIRGDRRVTVEKDARHVSVNADRIEQSLLLEDRFRFRQRIPDTFDYGSKWYGSGEHEYDAVDDREKMEELADKLIDTWNAAQVSGYVTLEGLDRLKEELGYVVHRIEGRNISLDSSVGFDIAFPLITAIEINVPGQRVTYSLQSFREEAPPDA